MTSVRLTGFPDGKKIHAIKALRGATGLGLKETKDIIDAVERDGSYDFELGLGYTFDEKFFRLLDEGGVTHEFKRDETLLRDHIEFLSRFPRDLVIGTLLDALVPTQKMVDEAGLAVEPIKKKAS